MPSNVIGFKALWRVTEKDFEEVLIPSVKDHVQKTGKLNCLIVLNNSIRHFKISALKGIKHLMKWKSKWHRVAIVSESKGSKMLINFLSFLIAGEFKVFSHTQLSEAIEWASRGTS